MLINTEHEFCIVCASLKHIQCSCAENLKVSLGTNEKDTDLFEDLSEFMVSKKESAFAFLLQSKAVILQSL